MRRRSTIRRDLFWVCERYIKTRKHTPVGQAACRLLDTEPTTETLDGYLADLKMVLEAVWEIGPYGLYVTSLRSQGAALRLQAELDVPCVDAVYLLRRESAA